VKADFSVYRDGLFCSYMPNNRTAELAYGQMVAQSGSARVFACHEASVSAQLEAAGYTVRAARRAVVNDAAEDALLAALES
jgi:hypothetical protein